MGKGDRRREGRGRKYGKEGEVGGWGGAGKGGKREVLPTDCCGCRPTTRESDNVVAVAVADIFLFIFLSVVSASPSAELGSPGQRRQPPRSRKSQTGDLGN